MKKILRGQQRELTARFIAFRWHWRYQAEFCTPGEGHEQGGVEGEVGYFRRNPWVPVPVAADLAALNRKLLEDCRADESRIVSGQTECVGTLLLAEKEHLLPLAAEAFDLAEVSFPRVDQTGCAKVRTNSYSVPLKPGSIVEARVSSTTVEFRHHGNRWSQNAPQGGPAPQLSFNLANNQVSSYSYDATGNIMSDGINSYQYDAEGNLTQETSGSTVLFTYNALNQQVRSDFSASSVSENVFDFAGKMASLWLNGGLIMGKAYWGSTPIEPYQTGPNMAYFQHRDWLGSLRLVTTATGSVKGVRTNLPFGDDAVNVSGGRDNSFDGFTGLWDGVSSATNHAQFREYSNMTGRWLQPDPYDGSYDGSNPQSLNRYAYVLNNPLVFTDALGLACFGHAGFTVYGNGAVSEDGLVVDSCDSEAGRTIKTMVLQNFTGGPAGNWDIWLGDISLVHPDGTFVPLYSRSIGCF